MRIFELDFARTRRVWRALAAFLLCVTLGCGGNDDPPINAELNNTGNNGGSNNGADAGADAVDGADGADGADADGELIGQSCASPPEELGTFGAGDSHEYVRGFHVRNHPNRATCEEAAPRAGVYWFSFEVDEVLMARFEVESTAASDPLIELRQEECVSADEVLFCTDTLTQTQAVEPGRTYYLLVQGAEDSSTGDFRLDLSFEQAACNPAQTTCDSGEMQICPDGSELVTRACAADCHDASSCAGDVCDTAVPVDLSTPGSTQTISGNRQAYSNDWDASGLSGCGLQPGQSANPTPNADILLKLSGHEEGDTILFDAENGSVDFGFYLLSSCAASSCMAAGAYDELGDNRFEWQANAAQEVFVVAETVGRDRDHDFQIDITRQ